MSNKNVFRGGAWRDPPLKAENQVLRQRLVDNLRKHGNKKMWQARDSGPYVNDTNPIRNSKL
jgi:hypothetical protein